MEHSSGCKEFLTELIDREEVVRLAQSLIRIPSHEFVEDRERDVALFLKSYCEQQGLDVELVPVIGRRMNVIVRHRGAGGGRTLMLNGHLDTVPPFDMDFDPFEARIEDGYILGRGAVDMKGAIAAMITAMTALKRSKVKLKGDVIFTGVIGEERKSEGTEAIVKSGIKADGAIVGEPSNYEYAIGHRGLECLEIEVEGKVAHGGLPHLGVNAIEKASDIIQAIKQQMYPKLEQRYNPKMGPSVMNFGVIKGGRQTSVVADRCSILIDRRYITGETVESVIKEYQDIIDGLAEKDPSFKANINRLTDYLDHPPLDTHEEHPIVQTTKKAIRTVIDKDPEITNERGWTDAGLLSGLAKIPTVVFGPGDISYSHSRNEKIRISELVDGVKIYMLSILDFCMTE